MASRFALMLGLAALMLSAGLEPALAKAPKRIPMDHRWGRCLLVMDGKTLISGRCIYQITKDGELYMTGPRQVFDGIDYPVAHSGAEQMSKDYWARISREDDGTWRAYGNHDVKATHGDWVAERMERKGACYGGKTDRDEAVRACVWRD